MLSIFSFGLSKGENLDASQTCEALKARTIYRALRTTLTKIKQYKIQYRNLCFYLFLTLMYLSGIRPSFPRYDPFHQSDETREYTIKVSFFLKDNSRSVRPEKSYCATASIISDSEIFKYFQINILRKWVLWSYYWFILLNWIFVGINYIVFNFPSCADIIYMQNYHYSYCYYKKIILLTTQTTMKR